MNGEAHTANSRSTAFVVSPRKRKFQKITQSAGQSLLFLVAAFVAVIVLFIFWFVARDAVPFFQIRGFHEFFTDTRWYPADDPPVFGALAIIYGSLMVTVGSAMIAIPMGISAAICLSDVLPFSARQYIKPVIEMLAAIPSVAYGFFALVIFAPMLQNYGGPMLMWLWWILGTPLFLLASVVLSELVASRFVDEKRRKMPQRILLAALLACSLGALFVIGRQLQTIEIVTGTNALNVSIILGFMALPTIVSVAEDALQAVGRDMREGSYALGATRAETIVKIILPAASSGILAGVILGIMRALGETMVVWMASGNASHIPDPWFNYLDSIRTLTATIAGDMGEADQVTGSARFHVLFAMGLLLLVISFVSNFISERIVVRQRRILSGQ
jgi:phosphate transport system permease protein